jgi:hypothetical protein
MGKLGYQGRMPEENRLHDRVGNMNFMFRTISLAAALVTPLAADNWKDSAAL